MKKLLLIITVLILTVTLTGCVSKDNPELEERVSELEAQVAEIEAVLENIGVIEGLNGQRDYYYIEPETSTSGLFKKVSAEEQFLAGTLDKDKAPSYLLDVNDEWVDFEDLGALLKVKYYGAVSIDDYYLLGFQTKLRMVIVEEMTIEDFIARTILLLEELQQYDFYLIGGPELYLQVDLGTELIEIKIYMPSFRSDFVTITPEAIYKEWYEIDIRHVEYNFDTVQSQYDSYVLNETFTGYVLNYK